jgi:hypothetical protein
LNEASGSTSRKTAGEEDEGDGDGLPKETAMISFNIPWRSRTTGFGFKFHNFSSRFDAWMPAMDSPAIGDIVVGSSSSSASIQGQYSSGSSSSSSSNIIEGAFPAEIHQDSRNSNSSISSALSTESTTNSVFKSRVFLCSAGLRPLDPRGNTGIPAVLEFVEHHTQLGFDHIFLGVSLDW